MEAVGWSKGAAEGQMGDAEEAGDAQRRPSELQLVEEEIQN